MSVVNPNNATHSIVIIPRFSDFADVDIDLYNEETQERTTAISNTYTFVNGYLTITFAATFIEGEKYQITAYEGSDIIYRGKIMATSQNTQAFKSDNGLYFYE